MNNIVLAKMAVKIAADTAEFKGAMAKTESQLSGFQKNITTLATQIGVAFGTQEVLQFAFEISKLAGVAEGVEAAFSKIPNSVKLMDQLKAATSGTVSELELMKRTVQASNFGISLESLPKLLEFAAVRAQQTGESVDYLVDSIVRGIGRKSPLILDNLGISAVRLKEEFNGASIEAQGIGDVAEAVGRIATAELEKMGTASENTATKIARVDASWQNLKVTVGKKLNNSGVLNFFLELTNAALVGNTALDEFEYELLNFNKSLKSGNFTGSYALQLQELSEKAEAAGKKVVILSDGINKMAIAKPFNETVAAVTASDEAIKKQIETLQSLNAKLGELNTQFETTDANDTKKLQNIGAEILAIRSQIDTLEELRKKQEQLQTQFAKDQAAGKNPSILPDSARTSPDNPFSSSIEVPDITPQMDAYVEQINRGKVSLEDWGEQMRITSEIQEAEFERQKNSALSFGDAVGSALGSAIEGQQKAADVLRGLTNTVIQQFFKQAIAGIIASGATSGGPTPIALGFAAAGVAAISAMFSKIGGTGGGSGSAGLARQASTNIRRTDNVTNTVSVQVEGELKIQGRDLVAAVEKNQRLDKQRKVS